MNYYYDVNGKTHGPVSAAGLKALLDAREIALTTLACGEGGDRWAPVSEIAGSAPPDRPANPGTPIIGAVVLILILAAIPGAFLWRQTRQTSAGRAPQKNPENGVYAYSAAEMASRDRYPGVKVDWNPLTGRVTKSGAIYNVELDAAGKTPAGDPMPMLITAQMTWDGARWTVVSMTSRPK